MLRKPCPDVGASAALAFALVVLIASGGLAESTEDRAEPVTPGNPRAGEWCDTDAAWMRKALQLYGVRAGCPMEGTCDDPAMRDLHIPDASTPVKIIRLNILVFAEDNGSNPAATDEDIDAQLLQLNADFAPYRFRFVHTCRFVHDSTYRHLTTNAEIDAMKLDNAERPDIQCNVYVTDLPPEVGGRGTFPWDPDALGDLGGLIIDETVFGEGQRVMTHEMGHCLGLWHTHHGVDDEVDNDPATQIPCSDPCRELADGSNGDTTGDFAADTPPTPINFTCAPPAPPNDLDFCSPFWNPWGPTQPENYMSYGGFRGRRAGPCSPTSRRGVCTVGRSRRPACGAGCANRWPSSGPS